MPGPAIARHGHPSRGARTRTGPAPRRGAGRLGRHALGRRVPAPSGSSSRSRRCCSAWVRWRRSAASPSSPWSAPPSRLPVDGSSRPVSRRALATHGATVVSGLAVGIDGVRTRRSTELASPTVAVIGGGMAVGVPRAHRLLARAILDTGGADRRRACPGRRADPGHLPRRNRIISGLALATVRDRGADPQRRAHHRPSRARAGPAVFVAPGRPGDPAMAGALALLRETPARPLVGIEELVVDLEIVGGPRARAIAPRVPLSITRTPSRPSVRSSDRSPRPGQRTREHRRHRPVTVSAFGRRGCAHAAPAAGMGRVHGPAQLPGGTVAPDRIRREIGILPTPSFAPRAPSVIGDARRVSRNGGLRCCVFRRPDSAGRSGACRRARIRSRRRSGGSTCRVRNVTQDTYGDSARRWWRPRTTATGCACGVPASGRSSSTAI